MTQLTRSFLKLSNRTYTEVTPEAMNFRQMQKKKKKSIYLISIPSNINKKCEKQPSLSILVNMNRVIINIIKLELF